MFPSVPRLYTRIYGKINDNFKAVKGCKAWLVKKALSTKLENLRKDGTVTHGCYDKLVFGKVKALLGGNVKLMLTGSAPMAAEVIDFIKVVFCAPLHEGYGLTETSAASAITFAKDKESGFVGGPLACVKFRTRDIPEMDYYSTDKEPRGEL